MDLNTLWFIIISVLFCGFFVLEGFDFGVGMLLPFVGRTDTERRMVINSIGPFWDGNEVWLITAGGAMFAAFPHWYATLFSGFYVPLTLLLFALIIRGVGFEFRSKDKHPTWRRTWDWLIFTGSALPALIFGVFIANFIVPHAIDANKHLQSSLFDVLTFSALVGGIYFVLAFLLHGSLFLWLKLDGAILQRIERLAKVFAWATLLFLFVTDFLLFFQQLPLVGSLSSSTIYALAGLSWLAAIGSLYHVYRKQTGRAFASSCVLVLISAAKFFAFLFPRLMISGLNPEWSLTIYNAASGPFTLKLMTYVAAIFFPVVLLYQGWTYWIFRKRITEKSMLEY